MTTTATPATTPDLTFYRVVHRAIRTAATELADVAVDIESADRTRRAAYARYWKGFAGEVLHHHSVEDDIFFPALEARVPVAVELTVRTDIDHTHLDRLMESIDAAVADLRAGRPTPTLVALTRELDHHMADHLDFEDQDILPLLERHFTAEEYDALDAAAVKSAGLGRQTAFSVPMIVGAMTPEERAEIIPGAPLPLRVLYRLTRSSHERLRSGAFGRPLVGAA